MTIRDQPDAVLATRRIRDDDEKMVVKRRPQTMRRGQVRYLQKVGNLVHAVSWAVSRNKVV